MKAREVLSQYFASQRELVEAKQIDERSVIVSLPLHYSGFTRVEIAVTQITPTDFVLSDLAQTLGELRDSGYSVTDKLKERILEVTRPWRIKLSGDNLIRTSSGEKLGEAIQEFAEATKTIGDAYLAYPSRLSKTAEEEELKQRVRRTLDAKRLHYREKQVLKGRVEEHKVDFFLPPNGTKGLAMAVLARPDHIHAEAWGFRAKDIKELHPLLLIGVVYDASAKELSRNVLNNVADIPVSSAELDSFGERLDDLLPASEPTSDDELDEVV